jgi:hypothetical protein
MRRGLLAFLILLFSSGLVAENQEKAQKKDLESQAKIILGEAKALEGSGQLAEAREICRVAGLDRNERGCNGN